ncbi:MAG: glycosyltransferase [Nostocaceae cyanobacterium]|nr:glycosyltransferase [Nostocaceae cyanobacterium]
MNVVSRVQFPKTSETSDLCIKYDGNASINFEASDCQVILAQGSTISFNTYFNSIYETFYTKYTTLSEIYYLLKLEGDFEVSVYREFEAKSKELISTQTIKECQLSTKVKILLPLLKQSQEAGRIYLEITCLSERGIFTEGLVVTEQEKLRDVSLAAITCTFKKEAYVRNTVSVIVQDSFLSAKNFKVFVVDNGKTLNPSDFPDSKVRLISNRNVGGSGGFTKGLIEALQEGIYTHFLFMDDDIELDSEVIYRLISLYEYASQDFAVAGSMLDLYMKHMLYEAGGLYNQEVNEQGNAKYRQFRITSLKNNLDLRSAATLNSLLVQDENIDYGAFWFFAFSKEVVEKIGLPLPLFIKGDDQEYGLRIKEHFGSKMIVAFASFAVWHEPFYAKKPVWDTYYTVRNDLINGSIHSSLTYANTIKSITKSIIYQILIFDYNSAEMFIKGFDDYMQGPGVIRNNDAEVLHSQVFARSKSHQSQSMVPNHLPHSTDYKITKVGKFQKIMSLLTLNGHLLPKSLISDESATIRFAPEHRDSICKLLTKSRGVFILEKNPQIYHNELDKQAGISILFAWLKSVAKSRLLWSKVNADWQNSAQDFTTMQFWQDYLEPHN